MEPILLDNIHALEQGIAFLDSLEPSAYTKPCAGCFNSAIGGHIRHNLDHYESFLSGLTEGCVNYDARSRDPRIESDPAFAASRLRSVRDRLHDMDGLQLDRRMSVRMDGGGASDWSDTSIRRELQFLLSHSIHHYALIVAISSAQGRQEFPPQFGVAPSTVKHQQNR